MSDIDCYKVLGVSPDANEQEIKNEHRRLVKRYHPDTNKEADAVTRFLEIQQAYEVLADPVKRKKYDDKRQRSSPKASSPVPSVEHQYIFPNLVPNVPITLDFGSITYPLTAQNVNVLLTQGVLRGIALETHTYKNHCHRCGHQWEGIPSAHSSRIPKYCPKCRADDWSEYLILHCSYCAATFEGKGDIRETIVEDRKGDLFFPYEIFPQCPNCKRSRWCFSEEERLRLQRKEAFRASQRQSVKERSDLDISTDPHEPVMAKEEVQASFQHEQDTKQPDPDKHAEESSSHAFRSQGTQDASTEQTSYVADTPLHQAPSTRTYSRRLVAIGLLGMGFATCYAVGQVMFALRSQTGSSLAARPQLQPSPPTSFRRPGEPSTVAWNPRGDVIAYAGWTSYQNFHGVVSLLSHKTMSGLFSYYHIDAVAAVAWAPNGIYLASGSYNEIHIWDIGQQKEIVTYKQFASSLAWSPDTKYIVGGGNNDSIQVWEAMTGNVVYRFTGDEQAVVPSAVWSPNGKRIASSNLNQIIKIWDAPDGGHTILCTCTDDPSVFDISIALDWSPDSNRIVSGANNILQVWNAESGKQLLQFKGHRSHISCVRWSPNGNFIASGSWDKTVRIWNVSSGEGFTSFTLTDEEEIQDLSWSPDSQFLVSVSYDVVTSKNSLRIWNVSTGYGGIF